MRIKKRGLGALYFTNTSSFNGEEIMARFPVFVILRKSQVISGSLNNSSVVPKQIFLPIIFNGIRRQ